MSRSRDITKKEQLAMDLVKALEYALDNHRLTIRLTMTPAGAEAAAKIPDLKIFKSEYDKKRDLWLVTLTISEYMKYVDYAIHQAGMSITLDGSLLTSDNLVISNDYLN
jgi:hypothetical protein